MRWKSIYSSLLRFSKSLAYLLPHILCKYLYYLSEMFTNYYSSVCKVGSFAETSTLLLCETTTVVMEKCFLLSGIIPGYSISARSLLLSLRSSTKRPMDVNAPEL